MDLARVPKLLQSLEDKITSSVKNKEEVVPGANQYEPVWLINQDLVSCPVPV